MVYETRLCIQLFSKTKYCYRPIVQCFLFYTITQLHKRAKNPVIASHASESGVSSHEFGEGNDVV